MPAAAIPWIVGGLSAAGTVATAVGANQQRKDQKASDAANRAEAANSDLNSWRSYLMQRGISPDGVTAFGQVPTSPVATNSRLPLWANLSIPTQTSAPGSVVRRKTPRVV